MKPTVKVPKSIKRLLATMDKQARSDFLRLTVKVLEQESYSKTHRPRDNNNKKDQE